MKPIRACFPLAVVLLGACGTHASGPAEAPTTLPVATTAVTSPRSTSSPEDFVRRAQQLCLDIGERAYRDVQVVFPANATPTPQRRIEEARIRAAATDELVQGLQELAPAASVMDRWDSIISGLIGYADHERSLAAAIEAGTPEPERPDGLENFRDLGLGGTCDDWLDMN